METSAVAAIAPIAAVLPMSVVALAVFWLPVHLVWEVPFVWFALGYLAAGVVLFLRPLQVVVVARLMGARRPTRDERVRLETAWRSVAQANDIPPQRYALAVLPAGEVNAFACGGHLLVVTSYAVDTLARDELTGVLAHELSHHLGLHTVALTLGQWLGAPVLALARIGFFLQSVATAATRSYASHSAALTAIGRIVSAVLTAVSWMFLSALVVSSAISNAVGRRAEFQADGRAVAMGFGRELASALRRVVAQGGSDRPRGLRERLAATHPPPRTRVARIEAMVRSRHPSTTDLRPRPPRP